MKKKRKIATRLGYALAEWLMVVIIVGAFFIRSSVVQTYFATLVTDYFSKEWQTTVSVQKVDILFIDRIEIKGVLLLNQTQTDTIVALNSLIVRVDGWSSFHKRIKLRSLSLKNGLINLQKEKATEQINIRFIIDYFQQDQPNSEPFMPVFVGGLHLEDMRFRFDNQLEPPIDHRGMDYQHLYLTDIDLDAGNVALNNGVITGRLNHLSACEKSGFQLKKWMCQIVNVSHKGIHLKDISVATTHSVVRSNRFALLYDQWMDFQSFVDSVSFDATIEPSRVSLVDIAFFAPQLIGMNQECVLQGKVSKRIKNLKVNELELKTGVNTVLRGTITLPDFRYIREAFYQERLDYALIDFHDIQHMRLPYSSTTPTLHLDENIQRLGYLQATNVRLDGIFSQFVFSSDEIYTQLGSVQLDNGILFTYNADNESFLLTRSQAKDYDVKINHFHLGKFLNSSLVGFVDGSFFLSGEAFSLSDIAFQHIEGTVNRCDIADYSYSNISVSNAHLSDKILYAEATVNDKNIQLNYHGTIDLNDTPKMDMTVHLKKAMLGKLHFTDNDSTNLIGIIQIDALGLNPNTMEGTAQIQELQYVQGDKQIDIPQINFTVKRGLNNDMYQLRSSLVNAEFNGKIKDLAQIKQVAIDQFYHLFPHLRPLDNKDNRIHSALVHSEDCMEFDIEVLDMDMFWDIFYPPLQLSRHTTIRGDYDASKRFFEMDIRSDKITYNQVEASTVHLYQFVDSATIEADYTIQTMVVTDSITLNEIHFLGQGNGNNLQSQLTWNTNNEDPSKITWCTQLTEKTHLYLNFAPSYFVLNKQKWNIDKEATVILGDKLMEVNNFRINSNEQFISVNGKVSTDDNDKLQFLIDEIDLHKMSQMLGFDVALEGKLNGWGYIVNPYDNLRYLGDMKIQGFTIKQEEVGDIYFMSQWNNTQKLVNISGDLIHGNNSSCQFEGTYDIFTKEDNIDMGIIFDHTNIAFVTAFIDELVIDNVSGYINGRIEMSGSLARPILDGQIELEQTQARIVMLGTNFFVHGTMYADKDGFYIDYMPISDIEGNTGALTGSVFHTDYSNWNVNVEINIEEDYYKRDPNRSWVRLPLERFLILDTDGSKDDVYYGKAYATGTIGIFGTPDNLEFNVTLRSQRGTSVNLDFFAQRDLNEDDFIAFYSPKDTVEQIQRTINYSGVLMNLDFDITRDAQLRLIFNQLTGDEIIAFGEGNIALKLDRMGQISLDGKYTTQEGSKYNFVLGPIRETFLIEEGGSVIWTGDPYQATLNLKAYTEIRANLSDIAPELLTNANQPINCFILLSESLMKPTIGFDIKAPKASEQDKTLLSQIATEEDELNRQFFSLLMWKKFQPMKGTTRANSGAALDFASNQINSLLSQVSKEYQLNVSMTSDALGKNEYALGIKKGFLDDQLVVSGMFGSRSMTTEEQTQSAFIGDVEIEYKLNKEGTFRINVFNESNDNRSLQSINRGLTKQGIGIHYRESFNTLNDFKLLQQMMDIARRKNKKRHPIRRKKQQTKIVHPSADE